MKNSWENMKLSKVLSQYREEIWVDDTKVYPQLTNSKYDGIGLRGNKIGAEIGRKRQFVVNLDKYPNTITFTRQTIQVDEAIGLCPPQVNGCIVTENMPLFTVENAEPKFIEYFFRTRLFLDQLHKTAALGTSQQSVHEDIFLNYEIPLPPLPEQERIVSKIETVKERIEQIKILRAEQEKEIRNLIYSLFEDFKKAFGKKPIGNVLRRADRFEKKDSTIDYTFSGTYSFGRGIFKSYKKNGSEFNLEKIQRIKKDDFIFCKIMAWEGAFGLAPEECDNTVMSGAFVAYEIDRNLIHPTYLENYFKIEDYWKDIGSKSTGTNVRRKTLSPEDFENYQIPLPPIEEQNRIVSLLNKMNGVKTNHTVTEKELTQLMPALLDKAFKVEL